MFCILKWVISKQTLHRQKKKSLSKYSGKGSTPFFITIKCQHALEVKLDLVEANTMYNGKYLFWYLVVKEDEANDSWIKDLIL